MIDPSVKLNEVQAEKLCKQTENLYPYHPTIYKLKERLLTSNGNCDSSKIENLLKGIYIYDNLFVFSSHKYLFKKLSKLKKLNKYKLIILIIK